MVSTSPSPFASYPVFIICHHVAVSSLGTFGICITFNGTLRVSIITVEVKITVRDKALSYVSSFGAWTILPLPTPSSSPNSYEVNVNTDPVSSINLSSCSSFSGFHMSSASRNDMNRPRDSSIPLLRETAGPSFVLLVISLTLSSHFSARNLRITSTLESVDASSTRRSSQFSYVCCSTINRVCSM